MPGEGPSGLPPDDPEARYKWKVCKRRGSPVIQEPKKPMVTPVQNQYASLSDLEDSGEDTRSIQGDEATTAGEKSGEKTVPKPVDIMFPPVDNIDEFLKEINHVIGRESFEHTTQLDGRIRITCDSVDTYRDLIRYCDRKDLHHQTWQLKHLRAFRCVIEGLHNSTSLSMIKEEFQKYGHSIRHIAVARHRVEKYPIDYFFIDLEPSPNNRTVYDIIYIGNAKVRVVPPRKVDDYEPQCHRCQGYGHTWRFCKNPWVCVKCGGNHSYRDCTKPKDAPPTCCFCKGDHPSNYRGCSVNQERIRRRKARQQQTHQRQAETPRQFQPTDFPPTPGSTQGTSQAHNQPPNGHSYARPNGPQDRMEAMLDRMERMMATQMSTINTLINLVTSLINNKK